MARAKPSARTGHSFCLIGSKIFVFGGQPANQKELVYANDLWAFDINTLFAAEAQWEQLTVDDGHSPSPQSGHSAVIHLGKLYIFGGTNGQIVFSDTWMYDPVSHTWAEIVPKGYIPIERHSHSASIVAGMMFIFGGINGTGALTNDFSALNIATGYWHRFDTSSGAWPEARAMHGMTAIKSRLYLFGGDIAYPHSHDRIVHVTDVASMRFPEEKPGFSTQNNLRARLVTARLHKEISSSAPPVHKRGDHDAMSIMSAGSRSIRSIRSDLGKEITAALGSSNAQAALERVLARVQDKRAKSITAADVREMDKYCPASYHKPAQNKADISRSGSILSYFKRRRGSHTRTPSSTNLMNKKPNTGKQNKLDSTMPMTQSLAVQDQSSVATTIGIGKQENPNASLDLERFLSLEREIYKKYPDFGKVQQVSNQLYPLAEDSTGVATTALITPQVDTSLSRSIQITEQTPHPPADMARAPSANLYMESITESVPNREAQSILKRLGLSGNKNVKRKLTTSSDCGDAMLGSSIEPGLDSLQTRNQSGTNQGKQIDSHVLLQALTILRQELITQKKTLTAEKTAAHHQAKEAMTKADKEAQDKLEKLRKLDEDSINQLRHRVEALVASEAALSKQINTTDTERQNTLAELSQLRDLYSQTTTALRQAEHSLCRYETIEAEVAELNVRQAAQTQIIQQVTTHLGKFQLRATEAKQKLEAKTYRCNEAEKEILSLQAEVSELQLQVKHVHRLSSLAKYNWHASAEEAEQTQNVMFSGLQQLLEQEKTETQILASVEEERPTSDHVAALGISEHPRTDVKKSPSQAFPTKQGTSVNEYRIDNMADLQPALQTVPIHG